MDCAKCHVDKPETAFYLRPDTGTRRLICTVCHSERPARYAKTVAGRFSWAKSRARAGRKHRPGKGWLLDVTAYANLIAKPCHYCGFPLNETGVGLDRLDSDLPYQANNVVPCCIECNSAKNVYFTYEEMVEHVGPAIRRAKLARLGDLTRSHES